jgi:probable O-glycosylation ligase (exosortase A-associated)
MKGVLFTYCLTYGGAAAALFNPFIGLLVYVCFAIIRPDFMWEFSLPQGNYSRIVALGLLAGWVIHGCGNWRFGRAKPVVVTLLAFLAWSALSAAHAADQTVAWKPIGEMLKIVLPFLVGITTIDSAARLKALAWVIVLSHGYVAYELNMSYLTSGFNRVQELGFGSMDNNGVSIAMVACVGLAFFLGLHASRWWQKVLAFALAVLMIHVVLLSFSRGGMLALVVTGASAFLLIPKSPRHYLVLLLLVAGSLHLAGDEVQKRFGTIFAGEDKRDYSAESRLELWLGCLDCTARHPLLGVGPDHWPLTAPAYGFPPGKSAHTLWLQAAAELGLPGLGLLVAFYLVCVVRLWPLLRHCPEGADPWLQVAASMVIASVVGFAISAQFVSVIGLEAPYYIMLIGAGALKLASQPPGGTGSAGPVEGELPDGGSPLAGGEDAVAKVVL